MQKHTISIGVHGDLASSPGPNTNEGLGTRANGDLASSPGPNTNEGRPRNKG